MRSIAAFEASGLGWAWHRWKVPETAQVHGAVAGALGLREAAALSWVPEDLSAVPAATCLRGPDQDAALGDATLAPTAGATPAPGPASASPLVAHSACDPPLHEKVAYGTYGAAALLAAVATTAVVQKRAAAAPYSPVDIPAVLLELNPPPPCFSTEAGGAIPGFLLRPAARFRSGKQTRRVARRKTITQRVGGAARGRGAR